MTTQPRHPLDRGTLPMPVIREMIERQNARDAHYRAMFEAEQGYDFVDPLPRDDVPRFQYVIDRRNDDNAPDAKRRPSAMTLILVVSALIGAALWPEIGRAVAAIIQGAGQ